MSKLEGLRAKLAQAESARAMAESAITAEEREEIEIRRSIALAEEQREKAEIEKRELDLERRYEAACEEEPSAKITSLLVDDYPDSFVIRHSSAAYAKWETEITAAANNKKLDKARISRSYAVASVIDWNGLDLSDPMSPGGDLVEYLKRNPGIVTSIVNAAAKLAGAFSEARKS